MANRERTGWRDQAYSTWHRSLSDDLSFLDIDWIEWCKTCFKLLALYELKVDTPANENAQTWVTKALAEKANVKAFLVLYSKNATGVITRFRVRQLTPRAETELTVLSPSEWAERIYKFRWCHPIASPAPKAIVPAGHATHTHGWALVEGRWACVQDYYASGEAPQTACGELWDEAI